MENPVTRARGYAELSRHSMPGTDVVLAEIENLKHRLSLAEERAEVALSAAFVAGTQKFDNPLARAAASPRQGNLYGPLASDPPITLGSDFSSALPASYATSDFKVKKIPGAERVNAGARVVFATKS